MKTISALAAVLLFAWPIVAQDNCRTQPKPPKPFTPAGCIDTTPTCLCAGTVCNWIWACVPRGLPSVVAPPPLPSGTSSGIDPTIPLQIRPTQMPDLMDTYRKAMEIRNLQLQNQITRQQTEAQEQLRQQTELLRQQTEALRKQNEAASAAPAPTSNIGPTVAPTQVPRDTPPNNGDDALANVFTNDMLNCRGWRIAHADERLFYMIGILNGVQYGILSGLTAVGLPNGLPIERFQAELQEWAGKVFLTNRERVEAMDAFCAPAENSGIDVVGAVQIAAMKANGYTADQVETMAAMLRRQAAGAAK